MEFRTILERAIAVALIPCNMFAIPFLAIPLPLGFHRVWMRQPRWWLHTMAYTGTQICGVLFMQSGANAALASARFKAYGSYPVLTEYEYWQLGIIPLAWGVLCLYDLVMIFRWPSPHRLPTRSTSTGSANV